MGNHRSKQRLLRGLCGVTATVTTIACVGTGIINANRTDMDKFLGTTSTKTVTDESERDLMYTHKSGYKNTTELVQAIADVAERTQEEGTVLLKNENNALPLSSDEMSKVSLMGFSNYYPVVGGEMGSGVTENVGTDADTVDFVTALDAKGFKINPTLKDMYNALEADITTEVENWGMKFSYKHVTAPATDGTFRSIEPSQKTLDATNPNWKDTLKDNNVMIVMISRSASENGTYIPGSNGVDASQKLNQTDPLGLSDDERDLINAAVAAKEANGGKVVVLLNTACAMEVQEIQDNAGVDAIMNIGLPGGYGFYGVCDVLSGASNPSGHLADTYAVKSENSPAAQNYGNYMWTNADPANMINSALVEAEGIYTGYKYYETRYADAVAGAGNAASAKGASDGQAWDYDREVTYPFGYGLSYTSFQQNLDKVDVDLKAKTVTAQVTVTNTGNVAGKDAVQLYASVPYTEYDRKNLVEKSAISLLDYAKTSELAPGQSETVTITADAQYLTSYDSSANGGEGGYILDDGTYYFSVGNGAHEAMKNVLTAQGQDVSGNAENVKTWELAAFDQTTFANSKNGTKVTNQLADMDLNKWMPGTVTYLSRQDWEGTWPKTYENLTATEEMMSYLDNDIYEITANGDTSKVTFGADNGMRLAQMKDAAYDDERWSSLMDQLQLTDGMIRIAFGGTSTKPIASIGSPEAIQNDGPNGLYSYPIGQYANTDASTGDPCVISADDKNFGYKAGVMPNETVIAATFNKDIARDYGAVMGNYSLWANQTIYWGASANIHRVPYNSRNHEYYSEDPMLSAYMAANFITGSKPYGLITALKHFAFNDTEINRTGVSVFMTEQKAREGELRCYQTAVEDANTLGVMTAYNRVGVTQANAHRGLMVNILRDEWGFKGLISEDFIQHPGYVHLKEAALNYVTMTCNTGESNMEAVTKVFPFWTEEAVAADATLSAAIKQCMYYQAYALANSNAMDGYAPSTHVESVNTWYDNLVMGLKVVFGLLTLLLVVGYVVASKKER
ncbi:MAG: glycoside hydrolase family 3 C-terminal domain-containing protein [Lachnospiraceae bacterium]|nr:glycoside hydrolase family 3 C-terminal domain-containing protein [Lachnospiraceae bacterium]